VLIFINYAFLNRAEK